MGGLECSPNKASSERLLPGARNNRVLEKFDPREASTKNETKHAAFFREDFFFFFFFGLMIICEDY